MIITVFIQLLNPMAISSIISEILIRQWIINNWVNPANTYLFKVNNKNTSQWRRSGVFIVNFEHISHLFLMFLLLTLEK